MTILPNFCNPTVLLEHARHTLGFYHPRAIDPAGGLFHHLDDPDKLFRPWG